MQVRCWLSKKLRFFKWKKLKLGYAFENREILGVFSVQLRVSTVIACQVKLEASAQKCFLCFRVPLPFFQQGLFRQAQAPLFGKCLRWEGAARQDPGAGVLLLGSACQGSPARAVLHPLNLNIPGHRHTRQALTPQSLERFESTVT